jgi:acyl carrier protein
MKSKEEILQVVKNHIIDTLEEVEDTEIKAEQSMKDLGANSLDIVEIVSCSMRELKVKVPRSELSKLEDIGALVDLLHQVLEEKEKAAEN